MHATTADQLRGLRSAMNRMGRCVHWLRPQCESEIPAPPAPTPLQPWAIRTREVVDHLRPELLEPQ